MDAKKAEEEISRVLLGASLDEFTAHSMQLKLRYLNDRLVTNRLIAIDVRFDCPAAVGKNAEESGDFFDSRSVFVSDIYRTFGREVSKVLVDDKGRLTLFIADTKISLASSAPSAGLEEEGWDILVEDFPTAGFTRLACAFGVAPEFTAIR